MKIRVKAIPNAKENEVLEGNGALKIRLTAPAIGGRANKMLIEIIARYLKVRKSKVRLISGEKSREKIFEADVGKDEKCLCE